MFKKAMLLWIVVLITGVPYATYYLFFEAPREQYAALITFVLFWIFGYWSLVGPLIGLLKFLKFKRAFENISSKEELIELIQNPETEDLAIDFIVRENGVPRFMAKWAYTKISQHLAVAAANSAKIT